MYKTIKNYNKVNSNSNYNYNIKSPLECAECDSTCDPGLSVNLNENNLKDGTSLPVINIDSNKNYIGYVQDGAGNSQINPAPCGNIPINSTNKLNCNNGPILLRSGITMSCCQNSNTEKGCVTCRDSKQNYTNCCPKYNNNGNILSYIIGADNDNFKYSDDLFVTSSEKTSDDFTKPQCIYKNKNQLDCNRFGGEKDGNGGCKCNKGWTTTDKDIAQGYGCSTVQRPPDTDKQQYYKTYDESGDLDWGDSLVVCPWGDNISLTPPEKSDCQLGKTVRQINGCNVYTDSFSNGPDCYVTLNNSKNPGIGYKIRVQKDFAHDTFGTGVASVHYPKKNVNAVYASGNKQHNAVILLGPVE